MNKITLKGKVKRDLTERRAMTRISARKTYKYLLPVVQMRNKIQTFVEHAMKAADSRILLTTCDAVWTAGG